MAPILTELLAFAPLALLLGVLLLERARRDYAIRSLEAVQKGYAVHGKAVKEKQEAERNP